MFRAFMCCFKARSTDHAHCQLAGGSGQSAAGAAPSTEGVSALPEPGPMEPRPLDLQAPATEGQVAVALSQRQASCLALSATPRAFPSAAPQASLAATPGTDTVASFGPADDAAFVPLQLSQAGSQGDELEEISI
jgi:hypothetical protein